MARPSLKPAQKALNALKRGNRLTTSRISKLGVKSPYGFINHLRVSKGMKIVNENGAYFLAK